MKEYDVEYRGKKYTEEFRAYITKDKKVVSPFHDIAAYPNPEDRSIVNVVNEIPRFSNAKMEINKQIKGNPITQDTKDRKVRNVHNVYPFKGYMWNYGAVPQTWEDKDKEDAFVGIKGDNDPIDIIEIGETYKGIGEVYQAKILGCIALVDGDECDWKIVVIDTNDPLASKLSDITCVEKSMPGILDDTREWFRNYKYPANGKKNKFALEEKYKDREMAINVVYSTHLHWKRLMENEKYEGISLSNTTLKDTKSYEEGGIEIEGSPYEDNNVPMETGKYFFVPAGKD